MPKISLIIGSAPDAVRARDWDRSAFTDIVAINNAWAVRPDWDYLIHPDDFPEGRLPDSPSPRFASIITSAEFVPAQNLFGGFVYAGGTMAFTAGYWALKALKPDIIAFLGCDMVYPANAPTHFYGVGTADPLRNDVTLRDLKAKSARLFAQALRHGTLCLNLSELPVTRLALPRVTLPLIERLTSARIKAIRAKFRSAIDDTSMENAIRLESELGYFVQNGRYWESISDFDGVSLSKIDGHWRSSVRNIPNSAFPSDFCGARGSKVVSPPVEIERFP
ncbi:MULTISPECIES: hypothetical protein [Mesorhizobium]|uniref:Uncharacterized protein n=1 Tax=Rhizobium loti TaxID=381 RepID=A0A6M7U251_RHILI|nr:MULTISPECIES: hypothetical protein [Mesorhizobium]KRB22500.1 hypothetical protein ASE05_14925 [Mesorhizobium sp. Root172]OBQ62167.1 hypothetical protein A8145_21130 [Mesorhizobium loti]QKC71235.1 hypothetical protein EB815_20400 [Mesorhizobium loti]QKC90217.1 hypothetical protein EB230_18760 [Mesorhizobium sp. NZP2234]